MKLIGCLDIKSPLSSRRHILVNDLYAKREGTGVSSQCSHGSILTLMLSKV